MSARVRDCCATNRIRCVNREMLIEVLARRRGLAPEAARNRLMREAFPGWRWPAMRLLSVFRAEKFRIDLDLVAEVARARSVAEVRHAVEIFRYRSKGQQSWLRNGLGVRASGRRLIDLADELFR